MEMHRSEIERLERWLSELPDSGEGDEEGVATNGTPAMVNKPRGELKEHDVVDKSVLDAAKEVLRHSRKSMSSYEITEVLKKAGYNFGDRQAVKSVGKALRVAANNKPNGELIYNQATGNYSLRVG